MQCFHVMCTPHPALKALKGYLMVCLFNNLSICFGSNQRTKLLHDVKLVVYTIFLLTDGLDKIFARLLFTVDLVV